jgi:hypothetical protein
MSAPKHPLSGLRLATATVALTLSMGAGTSLAGAPRDGAVPAASPLRADRLQTAQAAPADAGKNAQPPATQPQPPADPRAGDPSFEQARKLMQAIEAILQDTAKNRSDAKKLPSREDFLIPPLFSETREDREKKVRDLLDGAMGVVTEVPVVDVQKRIEERRKNIRDLENRIVRLRERQMTAPKDGMLPGIITDTVDSLQRDLEDANKRIAGNREDIGKAKKEVADALAKSGVQMNQAQVDMLLDSVMSGDLVRLIAVFNSAKAIDGQLGKLMSQSGDNLGAARKYFAMHAALFAMLVHAQDIAIGKIDTQYMPKLEAITSDIAKARTKTEELLRADNRPDQQRTLKANRDSQKLSEEAAKGYRRFLMQQREQLAAARKRSAHDLRIADNTFETVEASYQLRNLMRDSAASFEAIQKLEAPTFEQIFKNEDLRREFENLTRKLDAPSS